MAVVRLRPHMWPHWGREVSVKKCLEVVCFLKELVWIIRKKDIDLGHAPVKYDMAH